MAQLPIDPFHWTSPSSPCSVFYLPSVPVFPFPPSSGWGESFVAGCVLLPEH